MKDRLDNLISVFEKDKKNLVYMIIAYVVIILVVIVFIWWPKGKTYATYEKLDLEAKQIALAQNYINILNDLFKNKRTEEVKRLISNEYIRYTEKTADKIIQELEGANFFSDNVDIRGVSVYTDGNTYVYSTTIYSLNNSRVINVIEKYPYEYEIVFDDFYSYTKTSDSTTNQNIRFTVDSVYRNLKYIQFDMRIENLNDSYARFDFNSTMGVQAVLEDGTKYALANLISTEEYTNIESNMTVNKNFVFEIPAQLQNGIDYIIFNGVSLEFSQMNIKVNV